jgi:hypothetical protein
VNKSFIQTWETKIFGFMHTHKESKMTVAWACHCFFPSVNKSFLFRLGKNFQFHARAKSQKWLWRVSMSSFFSQVWINHLFRLGKNFRFHARAESKMTVARKCCFFPKCEYKSFILT